MSKVYLIFLHFQLLRVGQSELLNMHATIKIWLHLGAQNTYLATPQAKFQVIILTVEMDITWQIKIKKFAFALKDLIVGMLDK